MLAKCPRLLAGSQAVVAESRQFRHHWAGNPCGLTNSVKHLKLTISGRGAFGHQALERRRPC